MAYPGVVVMVRRIIAAAVLSAVFSASAIAGGKDPLSYPLRHYALVLSMTMLGGFVGWYAKVRRGLIPGSSLFALIGEMATSSLAGMGAFLVCDYLNVPLNITAAVSGLAGYMGGRAIEMGERYLVKRVESSRPMPLDGR